ncbi:high mobility group box domain-containing protein [Dichotomocladium elegans]|nr:high mobility group box domain-containing protein [Dichotomocladium elegans]
MRADPIPRNICEATEDDMIAMNVKRGHRRMIQRQISIMRSMNSNNPSCPIPIEPSASFYESTTMMDNASSSSTNSRKRKYRRHPKRDKNAPPKAPSAYMMFSNDMRSRIKDKSFSEMARMIGEQWKNLDPNDKQAYELKAMRAKDAYQVDMQQYRKTVEYKQHQKYLKNFKKNDKGKETRRHPSASPDSSGSTTDSNPNNGADSQQVFLVQLPRTASNGDERP